MAYMRRMMLTCEEATFISTKKIIQGVNLKDRMNLQMHLIACKHCRKYYYQTRIITSTLRHHAATAVKSSTFPNRMSAAEKSNLRKLISSKIQSK